MPERRRVSSPTLRFLGNYALLLCLFVPSAWMIATIPPLWRDADAYVQLTQDPRVATFWGHSPAYCYVAKIPLFLGAQWERWRGKPPGDQGTDPPQPALTDSGIWLLIIGQHLALCLAAFCFIRTVSNHFWMRLALAAIWASNALFYTFANCIGSETFGLILLIPLAERTLRLVRNPYEPRALDWRPSSSAHYLIASPSGSPPPPRKSSSSANSPGKISVMR